MKDSDELECAYGVHMTDLENREDCDMEDPISYLLLIIILEIIGIAAILAKFIQDWVRYNTTGRLPWISRHLPNWYPAFPSDLMSNQRKRRIKTRNQNDMTSCTLPSEHDFSSTQL